MQLEGEVKIKKVSQRKEGVKMKKFYFIVVAIIGVTALLLGGSVGMAEDKIKIRTVTFLPKNNDAVLAYSLVADKI